MKTFKKGNGMFGKKTLMTMAVVLLAVATAGAGFAQDNKLTSRLESFLATPDKVASSDGSVVIWVQFTDKGVQGDALQTALVEAEKNLTPAARIRRAKGYTGSHLVDEADLPLAGHYVDAVSATGAVLRKQSRWLNAASFTVAPDGLAAIAALPFVQKMDLVSRGLGEKPEPSPDAPAGFETGTLTEKGFNDLEYGPSLPGLAQINVPAAHDRGLSGQGVTVALFSTGFNLEHECLADVDVVGAWDFVDDDPYVYYQPARGDDPYQDTYGTAEMSILAGFSPDNIIGVAYGASVIVAKTEDVAREVVAEEDNWIAALEWAESLGADIVSSGIGYIDWHDFSDMDGSTASITIAAEMASVRGVCVVNSVGDMRGNPAWPGVIPPSDGFSVISVGSADLDNQVTGFSSPGPTTDGRIKPDVLALGSGTLVAFDWVDDMYQYGYGTNYATPLVAGVVALMLEQDPFLNPSQVARALRETASRSVLPDNDFGWGLANATAALDFWTPRIDHTPLVDQEGGSGAFPVTATVTGRTAVDANRIWLMWRLDGENWEMSPMTASGTDQYTASIPPRGTNVQMEYYIMVTDVAGHSAQSPAGAPTAFHTFMVGADKTAPVVVHTSLPNQVPAHWPPRLVLDAADNTALADVTLQFSFMGGGWQGPFAMTEVEGRYELDFPYTGPIVAGMQFSYLVMARDAASVPNIHVAGPYSFDVVEARGRILLVDDRKSSKSAEESDRSQGSDIPEADKTIGNLTTWMTEAGFAVEVRDGGNVSLSDFLEHDAVMVSCGSNWAPLAVGELRRTMVAWAERGGRIVVEGGEIGYAAAITPTYPELMTKVFHSAAYAGEDGSRLTVPSDLSDHPLVNRPHRLEGPLVIENTYGYDYGAADLMMAADDAKVLLKAAYGSDLGVIVYDDNTGPDAGQTVYMPFDIMKAPEAGGRALLENVLTYLVQEESAGPSNVTGQITLAGRTDHSGAVVSLGMSHSTVTAVDGTYELPGLWGGAYEITVEAAGYGTQTLPVELAEGDQLAGTNFFMRPVIQVAYSPTSSAVIPDNNPVGVESVVTVLESGELLGLTIDCDLKHYSIGQLTVTVTDPSGTEVVLHNKTGSTIDDLIGTWPVNLFVDGPGTLEDFLDGNPQGNWTLKVVDSSLGATGTLNSWTLNLAVADGNASPADDTLPAATRLVGNYPNPFNPRTTIDFELKAAGRAVVDVYDVRGSLVRRLVDGNLPAGRQQIIWDGKDSTGHEPASGLYFCRLRTADQTAILKMTLVR